MKTLTLQSFLVLSNWIFLYDNIFDLVEILQCGHSNHERYGFIFTLFVLYFHLFCSYGIFTFLQIFFTITFVNRNNGTDIFSPFFHVFINAPNATRLLVTSWLTVYLLISCTQAIYSPPCGKTQVLPNYKYVALMKCGLLTGTASHGHRAKRWLAHMTHNCITQSH